MSFSVKYLRDLFSFPGQAEDREVDIFLEDANGGGVSTQFLGPAGSELGTNIAFPVGVPEGYFLTTKDPNKITAPTWYPAVFMSGDFENKPVLIKPDNGEIVLGRFIPDGHSSGKWVYLNAQPVEGSWPVWTPIPD